jgi:hypothetical protein
MMSPRPDWRLSGLQGQRAQGTAACAGSRNANAWLTLERSWRSFVWQHSTKERIMRIIIAAAALAALAACGQTTKTTAPPETTTTEVTTPAPPAVVVITEADARSRLETDGYTNVTGLVQNPNGSWSATGTRNGQTTQVTIGENGVSAVTTTTTP